MRTMNVKLSDLDLARADASPLFAEVPFLSGEYTMTVDFSINPPGLMGFMEGVDVYGEDPDDCFDVVMNGLEYNQMIAYLEDLVW